LFIIFQALQLRQSVQQGFMVAEVGDERHTFSSHISSEDVVDARVTVRRRKGRRVVYQIKFPGQEVGEFMFVFTDLDVEVPHLVFSVAMAMVYAPILFPVRHACRCDVTFPSQAALSTEL
jgi:hypothetical protein